MPDLSSVVPAGGHYLIGKLYTCTFFVNISQGRFFLENHPTKILYWARVPGLTIRDCTGQPNNLMTKSTKLSAIDVTAKKVFEHLMLILEWRLVAKFTSMPSAPTPSFHFLDFPVFSFKLLPLNFFVCTTRHSICPISVITLYWAPSTLRTLEERLLSGVEKEEFSQIIFGKKFLGLY